MTNDRKKYIEEFWHKYEAMGNLDEEFPPSKEVFFSFLNSAYRAWLNSGKTSAQIEADIQHHIEMQKTFMKLRKAESRRSPRPRQKVHRRRA